MNYYHHTNICSCCKRSDVEHIGKSSYGWSFSFHATDTIRDYDDWIAELEGEGEIRNEDYDVVSIEDFKKMIEDKKGGRNHASEYPRRGMNFIDQYGHSFSEGEFC